MDNFNDAIILGEELFQSGKLDEAQTIFKEILQSNPEHYEAMNDLGTVFYLKGDISSAEDCYLKAYSIKNDNDDVLLNITDLYLNAKKWNDALPFIESYIRRNNNDFSRLNQLALIHMESGRTGQAIPLLESSLKIQPDQESIQNVLKTLKAKAVETAPPKQPVSSIKSAKTKSLQFSVCLIEPQGYKFAHFLHDLGKYLCYTFESAGYDCCIVKNHLYRDRINIIVGGHRLDDPKIVKEIADAGQYVVIQSEMLGEDTINNWPIQERYASVYLPLLKQAKVVWDGLERNRIQLMKFSIDAVSTRFGYLPQLEEIVHKKNKDIDFLYYGSITPHRKKMLDALIAKGGRIYVDFDSTAIYRNDLIARAHVNLAPKQSPEMDHLTGTRILYLVNNRSVVVVERCRDQAYVEHCFPTADTEEWADLCMETLRCPNLDQIADEYYERFKKINLADEINVIIERLK